LVFVAKYAVLLKTALVRKPFSNKILRSAGAASYDPGADAFEALPICQMLIDWAIMKISAVTGYKDAQHTGIFALSQIRLNT